MLDNTPNPDRIQTPPAAPVNPPTPADALNTPAPASAPDAQTQPQAAPPAAPAAGAPAQQPNPAQIAAAVDTQHHSSIGRAFRALMGNQVIYQIDPKTGKMAQVTTPEEPGQFFRSIIAGAMLGGATASRDKARGFAGGFAEGGNAEIEEKQKQDAQKRTQAQQDFQNQNTARAAATEEDLKRAEIAMHNSTTMRQNQLMQKENIDMHEEAAQKGRNQMSAYLDAGAKYVADGVSESEMNQYLKDNPDKIPMIWKATDTKIVIDPKTGKINHEFTYSAIDPNGNVKVPAAVLKDWKEAGLGDKDPDFYNVMTDGKEITVSQYNRLNEKAQRLLNVAHERKKGKIDLEKEAASIDQIKANVGHLKAETNKLNVEAKDKADGDKAWELLLSGGDLTKIPIKQKRLLIQGLNESANSTERSLHELPKDPVTGQPEDQVTAKKYAKEIEAYHTQLMKLQGIKVDDEKPAGTENAGGDSVRAERDGKVLYIPQNQLADFQRENPDAKVGKDVTISPEEERSNKVQTMLGGSAVKFAKEGVPSLDSFFNDQQLLTDGKGNYIVRDSDFKNPQWKSIGVGTNPRNPGAVK